MKKYLLLIILFSIGIDNLFAQTQQNKITASLVWINGTTIAVDFIVAADANLSGTGNPISILLRIPISSSPTSTTITLASSSFGLSLAQAGTNDNMGYFIYYFEGPEVNLDLAGWDNGMTQRIATFTVTGNPNSVLLSGGQYGTTGVPNGSGGFQWSGTALLTNNTETNLVSWPISQSISLPIRMTDFNLTKVGDATLVSWTTLFEFNTSYFEIQHSMDNKHWKTITSLSASGQSTITKTYSFRDQLVRTKNQKPSILYYRIKTVDLDQHFSFTETKSIQFGHEALMSLRNTIVKDRLIIEYDGHDQQIEFKIIDIQGKTMSTHPSKLHDGKGEFEITFGVRDLPAGVYHLVSVSQEEQFPSLRFVKEGNR